MSKPALERVARALCRAEGHPENIQFEGKPMWQSYLPNARAVLAELQNPTDAMAEAGAKSAYDLVLDVDAHGARTIFAAMIDAALIDGA
ncbi:hypothetical protein ACIPPQ_14515 [Sphingopyxis sp. LARHCG72]